MIINKKSQTDLSGFYIVYKGSTLNENESNYGISHLMEHLMCKQYEHLYDDFDRYSINWNAYTSNSEVVFHMKGLDEYLYKYRHSLLNSLLDFEIKKDEFEKEKNVVIQEYKDTFQDQFSSSYYNHFRKAYNNYGPIGKLESLENIGYEGVMEYWEKYLSKPTMIINISKNSDFDGYDNFNVNYPKKYNKSENDKLVYERIIEFNKSCVTGSFKISDDMAYIQFVLDMLGRSLQSPLMKEIREKRGLTYSIGNFVANCSEDEGLAITTLVTTDDKVQEVLDTYKMVFSNKDKYLTKERFELIKDFNTVKRKKDLINMYANGGKFITPKKWQIDSVIDDITFEKANEIFDKYLTFDKWEWIVDKDIFVK